MPRSIAPTVGDRWRDRLCRFATSGLTVAAFCRTEGVSPAGFYQWRKKLVDRPVSGGQRKLAISSSPAFVPVVPTSLASAVVVTLANGVRVEIRVVDHDLVGHVVQVAALTGCVGGES